ncbi:MAG: hypothetical protein IPM01_14780 [Burkholderiaceae bacterium]|nr:hypothetical protein [Burkholderiaceae bacterium]
MTAYLIDGQPRGGDAFSLRGIELITVRDGKLARKDVFWKQSRQPAWAGLASLPIAAHGRDQPAIARSRNSVSGLPRHAPPGVSVRRAYGASISRQLPRAVPLRR